MSYYNRYARNVNHKFSTQVDFFVFLVQLQFHNTKNARIHQMSRQLVQSFLISSLRTAGCAALEHDSKIFKGGAFLT